MEHPIGPMAIIKSAFRTAQQAVSTIKHRVGQFLGFRVTHHATSGQSITPLRQNPLAEKTRSRHNSIHSEKTTNTDLMISALRKPTNSSGSSRSILDGSTSIESMIDLLLKNKPSLDEELSPDGPEENLHNPEFDQFVDEMKKEFHIKFRRIPTDDLFDRTMWTNNDELKEEVRNFRYQITVQQDNLDHFFHVACIRSDDDLANLRILAERHVDFLINRRREILSKIDEMKNDL